MSSVGAIDGDGFGVELGWTDGVSVDTCVAISVGGVVSEAFGAEEIEATRAPVSLLQATTKNKNSRGRMTRLFIIQASSDFGAGQATLHG